MVGNEQYGTRHGQGLAHLDHGSTLQYRMRLRLVRPFCLRTGHNQACIVDEIVRCLCGTCKRWRLTHVDERLAGTAVHQELDATLMPLTRCRMERCVLPTYSCNIDVRMSIKKELDTLMIAIVRCRKERSEAVVCSSIDVGLSIQEELDTCKMATKRCRSKWCAVGGINSIDVGLSIKEQLDTLKLAID